jgi:phospholipase C
MTAAVRAVMPRCFPAAVEPGQGQPDRASSVRRANPRREDQVRHNFTAPSSRKTAERVRFGAAARFGLISDADWLYRGGCPRRSRRVGKEATMHVRVVLCAIGILAGATWEGRAATISQARKFVQHVVIIMQENRSYDSYFGTFPGGDGLPTDGRGQFTACIPLSVADPSLGCVRPFHNTSLYQSGSKHSYLAFAFDRDGGAMDGFVEQQRQVELSACRTNPKANPQKCAGYKIHDVMGYHNWQEIPNYWHYAETYMLQDHLFSPVAQSSSGAHLVLTSEWSAECRNSYNPMSCYSHRDPPFFVHQHPRPFTWTNLTWLLDNMGVSWRYYLSEGATPDCDDQTDTDTCDPEIQDARTQTLWNPLPWFTTFAANVRRNPQYVEHVTTIRAFYDDVAAGKLPAVCWIVPNRDIGEHPDNNIVDGMNYVTSLVNLIMQSPFYYHTVIFISWDEWGGFYDHVVPPVVEREKERVWGYGFRVPGLIISPYVAGHFDHQILSFDAYNRFIEDVFLDSQRLDPATDGRPDSRPFVPEAITTGTAYPHGRTVPIGDLLNDFDFSRKPIPPRILDNHVPDRSPR